jgi:hypothetical protein
MDNNGRRSDHNPGRNALIVNILALHFICAAILINIARVKSIQVTASGNGLQIKLKIFCLGYSKLLKCSIGIFTISLFAMPSRSSMPLHR